ncbi:hypothetical protein BH24ACI1_BH24ACI1_22830 [soil metagenome]
MKKILTIYFAVLICFSTQTFAQVSTNILVQISKAEDGLRYDKTLENLMKSPDEKIRQRAALAAGRIGDEKAVPMLANLLDNDLNQIRATAAFAIGEIESIKGADAILKTLKNEKIAAEVRARAVEAAGKLAAANAKDAKAIELGEAILDVLDAEIRNRKIDKLTVLLGLTAVLRARPEEGDFVTARFLTDIDARIRADAANTLSRLRAKNANEPLRAMLLADDAAIVRANAARALGAAEDKDAFNFLLEAAIEDEDSRARVSAIRSLGSLKNAKAADKLLERGEMLLNDYKISKAANSSEKNELLEIATTLGRILPNLDNEKAVKFLNDFREIDFYQSPEIEIAFARIAPEKYVNDVLSLIEKEGFFSLENAKKLNWRFGSSVAQGFGEIAALESNEKNNPVRQKAENFLGEALGLANGVLQGMAKQMKVKFEPQNIPDYLRAYALFKTGDLDKILREYLKNEDVIVRATAAELLGEQSSAKETIEALNTAFDKSITTDKNYNDAQLAILSALVKLDKTQAASSLRHALDAADFLVRRHAAQLIKQNDLTKDFPNIQNQIGTVKPYNSKTETKLGQILNTNADYIRAVSRKNARAVLTTDKGIFTIDLLPEDAPLTVDNFINLARKKYFNGLTIHRVVPNFVMQDGDPRGDGNGGPGWQIRCELNMVEYERGAVGMALSGKDTGGSQWFVTHSPQPHLNGGYTVFGKVNETDMKVVDNLVRGDKILSVKIVENNTVMLIKTTKRRVRNKQ